MDPKPRPFEPLSPPEWQILVCVYDLGSANPIEVSQQLRRRCLREFRPTTTGVLLWRIANKGYLSVEPKPQPRGRPLHTYTPTVPWQMALEWQFQKFVDNYLLSDEALDLLASLLEARTTAKC